MNILNRREYGDVEKVRQDVKTLHEIIGRQGINLFIDVIAEFVATTAQAFKFSAEERSAIIRRYPEELQNALDERL